MHLCADGFRQDELFLRAPVLFPLLLKLLFLLHDPEMRPPHLWLGAGPSKAHPLLPEDPDQLGKGGFTAQARTTLQCWGGVCV